MLTKERFQSIIYNLVYVIALTYFVGYFMRELLPQHVTNAVLAKPLCFVGEKLRTATLYSAVVVSLFFRELIMGFSPWFSAKIAVVLTPLYVTKWRQ